MLTAPTLLLTSLAALALGAIGLATVPAEPAYLVRRSDAHDAALLGGDAAAWERAGAIDWGTAPWPTRFRALATADALWLRFDATDDSPWHTYTQRDDRLWEEEVVEIFIDPDGDLRNYAEVEISPANVVCDLLMERGEPDKRGSLEWDFPALETRVVPLTDGAGTVLGWTAIARLPWAGFATLPDTEVGLPPAPGDGWRFNVFRIKRPFGPAEPRREMVLDAWSPVPERSFHVPEVFRTMEFE